MTRTLVLLAFVTGCVGQATAMLSPTPAPAGPAGGGTATCREIIETCDSQCTTPFCLNDCTARGNPQAQQQHAALLDCAQRNACADEACVRNACPGESSACEASGAPEQAAPPPPPPADPAPP